ncbi:MAG: TetR/AcrR family transcriptional regulator [Oscillospiraceae bacterium]|nr:TetR/AcrR family transcriptional regulator [Oscillospiraceae bacterium]
MKPDDKHTALIEGAIHVIANEGIDRATTKRIGTYTGINEAYIYRCFKGKEDLFVQAFLQLDKEFVNHIMLQVRVMDREDLPFEVRCRKFFSAVWSFVLHERDRSVCYIQYYHSHYFAKYSLNGRRERFKPVLDRCSSAFKPQADVWRLLNHILDILFSSAEQVFQGELPDDEKTQEYVYCLIYCGIEPYLAWSERECLAM